MCIRDRREDLRRLRAGLDAVERENALKDDDDSAVRQLVVASVDDLDRIENPELTTPAPTLIVGTQATPDPTPAPTPVKPTPQPESSDRDRRD